MQTARAGVIIVLLAAAVLVTYAAPRLELPRPRLLPVATFPERIGDWRMTAENEVKEDILKALPTARIVDRDYTDSKGRTVSFTIVTAAEMRDIHSPAVCLPGAGWQTDRDSTVGMDGVLMAQRVMSSRGQRYHVWFWYPPTPFDEPAHPLLRRLYRWRLRAPGTYRPDMLADLSSSLMVRVIAPDQPGYAEAVTDFAKQVQEPLRVLASQVRKTDER